MNRRPALIVITDLDGTLLDPATYDPGPARPVIARLKAAGVALVPCSSKTRAEIELLMNDLTIEGPFVCENGGAVYLPAPWVLPSIDGPAATGGRARGLRHWALQLGRPYAEVVAALRETAASLGIGVRGFADMSVADIARACGLRPLQAQLARLREFDEPFQIDSPDRRATDRLRRALGRRGVRVLEGGRFHHAVGDTDKGTAVSRLREFVSRRGPAVVAGLGDAPNDLDMLHAVDVPLIVRGTGAASIALQSALPDIPATPSTGPAGWAEAVTGLVDRWERGLWPGGAGGMGR